MTNLDSTLGFPGDSEVKASACKCRRPGFDPCIGKIPLRKERLPIPVFWPGEFLGLYSPWGCKESDATFTFKEKLLKKKKKQDGMIGKNSIETYITLCNIDSQWEFDE